MTRKKMFFCVSGISCDRLVSLKTQIRGHFIRFLNLSRPGIEPKICRAKTLAWPIRPANKTCKMENGVKTFYSVTKKRDVTTKTKNVRSKHSQRPQIPLVSLFAAQPKPRTGNIVTDIRKILQSTQQVVQRFIVYITGGAAAALELVLKDITLIAEAPLWSKFHGSCGRLLHSRCYNSTSLCLMSLPLFLFKDVMGSPLLVLQRNIEVGLDLLL